MSHIKVQMFPFQDVYSWNLYLPNRPQLLNKIKDPTLKMWAQDLNGLWKILGRHIKDKVNDHLDRYTILSVPNGFIVPGDRFREFYYW